jgi:GntR family transcriptional regulator
MTPQMPPLRSLETTSGVPLYQQIFVLLRNQIQSGDLAPGALVMGEVDLCAAFKVSRITARRALNELAQQGFVERTRGRGTIVSPRRPPDPMRATFDGLMENVGHIGRTTSVKVLHSGTEPATQEVAAQLQLKPGAPVLHALRVRQLADQGMSYLATWVPQDIATLIEGRDMSATPLLLLLEEAGVPVASATQTITATLADAAAASALGLPAGSPLIDVRRTVTDTNERPVEFIKILYRPELYQFHMSMRRVSGKDGRTWHADDAPAPVIHSQGVPT